MKYINPFLWSKPISDPDKVIGLEKFSEDISLTLKSGNSVALYGARDTGKTSFLTLLRSRLLEDQTEEADGREMIIINLERVNTPAAFIARIQESIKTHPNKKVRSAYREKISQREMKKSVAYKGVGASDTRIIVENDAQILEEMLRELANLKDKNFFPGKKNPKASVVIAFDEFQDLNECLGEPLGRIRASLSGLDSENISMLFTGSKEHIMKMMLENKEEAIFQEADEKTIPKIDYNQFYDFLEFSFESTGKKITEEALETILSLTNRHPKRTQELAYFVWQKHSDITEQNIYETWDEMIKDISYDSFQKEWDAIKENNAEAANMLTVIAEDRSIYSRDNKRLFNINKGNEKRVLEKLLNLGKINEEHEIIDPLFREWLKISSPYYKTNS